MGTTHFNQQRGELCACLTWEVVSSRRPGFTHPSPCIPGTHYRRGLCLRVGTQADRNTGPCLLQSLVGHRDGKLLKGFLPPAPLPEHLKTAALKIFYDFRSRLEHNPHSYPPCIRLCTLIPMNFVSSLLLPLSCLFHKSPNLFLPWDLCRSLLPG